MKEEIIEMSAAVWVPESTYFCARVVHVEHKESQAAVLIVASPLARAPRSQPIACSVPNISINLLLSVFPFAKRGKCSSV